jgi:alcohol dehydrogenase class IV
MDALCQLIESYTSTGDNAIARGLAWQGIHMAVRSIRKSCKDPRDLEARDSMSMAALLSGMALSHAGLGAVHGFAAPVGAHFPIPHGVICANLLPAVISANAEALGQDADRYAAIGRLIKTLPVEEAIAALISFSKRLLLDLKIPPLSSYGMNDGDIPKMVELAKQSSSMKYNPVKLSDDALTGILRAGIAGYPDAK